MKRLLLLACLVVLAAPALAGTVGLSWNPVTHSALAGYRIEVKKTGGVTTNVDVGNLTQHTLTVDDCAEYTFCVRARDSQGGVSATCSNVVTGWARPRVEAIEPIVGKTYRVKGSNFMPGVQLRDLQNGPHPDPASLVRESCTALTVAFPNMTGGETVTLRANNPDGVFGDSPDFILAPAAAIPVPTGLKRTDAVGAGG